MQKMFLKGGGLIASGLIHQWMGSLDYQIASYDPLIDPAYPEGNTKKRIYIFWHEYILFLLYLRRRCDLSILLSRHRDADYLEQVARIFGFGTVRGSTKRGGTTAILEMMQHSKNNHLAITPDGPRGPRRKLAPGCIYLASKLQLPLVIIGLGYQNPWRAPTWDKFAVPYPCTRARAISSPEIYIPPDLNAKQLENYCLSVTAMMNQLCDMAENWAVSGETFMGETPIVAGPLNNFCYHVRPKPAQIQQTQ